LGSGRFVERGADARGRRFDLIVGRGDDEDVAVGESIEFGGGERERS
jgi:hypothetical protein